jgi:hypothetical protein
MAAEDARVAARHVVQVHDDVALLVAADRALRHGDHVLLPELRAVDLNQAAVTAGRGRCVDSGNLGDPSFVGTHRK